jgi:hypothetical protein
LKSHPNNASNIVKLKNYCCLVSQRNRRGEMTRLGNVMFDYFIPMDFLVFTPQEIDKWKNAKNHVIAHALKEGRTLYESH